MKNITKHTGTLELIKRMKNSRDGNPQFMLAIIEYPEQRLGWRFRTPANSMLAYKAENFIGQKVDVTIGTFRGCATLASIREAVEYGTAIRQTTRRDKSRFCKIAKTLDKIRQKQCAAHRRQHNSEWRTAKL